MQDKREHWREDARCKGKPSSIFFPDHRILNEHRWDIAKAICNECPVWRDCLNMVLPFEDALDKWGMFGGLTPAERREMRHNKRRV